MKVSIVIPAYNEEKFIGRLFDSIKDMDVPSGVELDVVVVLNRCTDKTEIIAREFGAKIISNDTKNLSSIRNSGVKAATGEWVVTIDADSWMSQNTLIEICNEIETGNMVGGGIKLKPERSSLGISIGYALFLLPAFFLRLSFGLYWFKKDYFNRINGFNEKKLIGEDIDFLIRLKGFGRTIGKRYKKITKAHVVTSCRKFDQFGDWHFVRTFSNPCAVIRAAKGSNSQFLDKNWYEVKR